MIKTDGIKSDTMLHASQKNLVSVIICVYNGEAYLAEAIESVLNQTYEKLEVIVVDDGSTDGSQAVAKSYANKVVVHTQANGGLAFARNTGIQLAKGEYISFLDADDIWLPQKTKQQLSVLVEHPEIDMVFGHVQEFISPDAIEKMASRLLPRLNPVPGVFATTLLSRRTAMAHAEPFNTKWKRAEFIDWYSKACELGLQTYILPDVVARRRLHTSNMGVRLRGSETEYVRVIKALIDRRRNKDTNSIKGLAP